MRLARLLAAAVLLCLASAVPASAELVYVKDPANPKRPATVWIAKDDGSEARKLADGSIPRVAPDARTVAYVTARGTRQALMLVSAAGGEPRRLATSTTVESVRFSPDGKLIAAEIGGRRLVVYETATGRSGTIARGFIKGLSFAPDGAAVVFGRGVDDTALGRSDLYKVSALGGEPEQLTDDGRSLLPVWGPERIAFVKKKTAPREGGIPAYDIWTMTPAGGRVRRVTVTKVPDLVSGLLPIEFSKDGRRLIAQYVGQGVQVGFTVNPFRGRVRALSRNPARGKVVSGISDDGVDVLAMTGGPDPGARHDIVSTPYERGPTTVLVRNAAYPDWTR